MTAVYLACPNFLELGYAKELAASSIAHLLYGRPAAIGRTFLRISHPTLDRAKKRGLVRFIRFATRPSANAIGLGKTFSWP
jgi:hypothetical protein